MHGSARTEQSEVLADAESAGDRSAAVMALGIAGGARMVSQLGAVLVKLARTTSETVVAALAQHVLIPPEPQHPWQRGSNENTNGLLRQYFPKRITDLRIYADADRDAVPAELNGRPRKNLESMAP